MDELEISPGLTLSRSVPAQSETGAGAGAPAQISEPGPTGRAGRPLPRPGPIWGPAPQREESAGAIGFGGRGGAAGRRARTRSPGPLVTGALDQLLRLGPVGRLLGATGVLGGRRRQGLDPEGLAREADLRLTALRQAAGGAAGVDPAAADPGASDRPTCGDADFEQLRLRLPAIRRRLARDGLSARAVLPALTLVAATLARTVGLSATPAQLRCALVLLDGALAELDTGEGKTCSAALAAAVLGLAGVPVHVLTANDYLAERDARTMAPMFEALGLGLDCARETDRPIRRAQAYRARIVYTTARCVAFDHLRDRLRETAIGAGSGRSGGPRSVGAAVDPLDRPLLTGLCAAIVDEADSILIDEASTPLILAAPRPDPGVRARLWRALDLARRLRPAQDHVLDPGGAGTFELTESGRARVAEAAADWGGLWVHEVYRQDLVAQALQALFSLRADVDYIVSQGRIVIVDPVSGRPSADRRWARDLHGLVALKEGLAPPAPDATEASLTYPRLFARYHHLSGLSGTLRRARGELWAQYGLAVDRVPRATTLLREDGPMRLFADRAQQFAAAAQRASTLAHEGRAVLITVDSVADAEALAALCVALGVPTTVLSARQSHAPQSAPGARAGTQAARAHADEAAVIAAAGRRASVTVATQMAGRGTDIQLAPEVRAQGGLHVLNLQLNRSARVDQQIAGRAGRRGDPGSYEHWIRLDDGPLSAWRRLVGGLGLMDHTHADRLSADPGPLSGGLRWGGSLARIMLAGWQAWCALDDRGRRAALVQADRHWADALHFARLSE